MRDETTVGSGISDVCERHGHQPLPDESVTEVLRSHGLSISNPEAVNRARAALERATEAARPGRAAREQAAIELAERQGHAA